MQWWVVDGERLLVGWLVVVVCLLLLLVVVVMVSLCVIACVLVSDSVCPRCCCGGVASAGFSCWLLKSGRIESMLPHLCTRAWCACVFQQIDILYAMRITPSPK